MQYQTRCFEIPTTSKHHLLIGKNKFMVIAMHELHIFRKLYSDCIIHFIASTLNFDIFQKCNTKTRCFEIPTTSKHHLLIGKNKFMVIAMHKLHIFRKLYKARNAHKRLYTVLPKYSKIQVLPDITSCRLMKYNKQAIELNSLLTNNMPKDGYE